MTERSEIQEAWTYYSAGKHLSDSEYDCLERAFEDDRVAEELVQDLQLHRTLNSLAGIDRSERGFVNDVVARCLGSNTIETQEKQVTPPPVPLSSSLVDVPPATSIQARRQRKASLWSHPLVLLLAVGSFVMLLLMVMIVQRYGTMKQQIADVTKRLESQHEVFESRLAQERTRRKNRATVNSQETNSSAPTPQKPLPPMTQGSPVFLAEVTRSGNAIWKTPPTANRLQNGEWELEQGSAELTLAGGSQLFLEAPTFFRLLNSQHVSLEEGSLTALVSPDDVGFRISTPTSRIVDLGTEFRVSVDTNGETDVEILQGEVVVIPWDGGPTGKRWRLARDKFQQATVSPFVENGQTMLASRASGTDRFESQIHLAGSSLDLESKDDFDRLRNGLTTKFAKSPSDTITDWQELTRTANSATGSINLNGKQIPIAGLNGVLNFESGLVNDGQSTPSSSTQQNSTFSGKININGRERTFSTPEEYEAFRREMFRSLPDFGLPGPKQTQFEIDQQTNPFLPN